MTKELQRLDHYGIEHVQGRYCMWDEADAIIRELRAANAVLTETIEQLEHENERLNDELTWAKRIGDN